MTRESHASLSGVWSQELLLESLTIPERIDLFRSDPSLFTPDEDRADVVADEWATKLGRDGKALIADRLADLGIEKSELPLVLGAIKPDATELLDHDSWFDVCLEVAEWTGSYDASGLPEASFLTSVDDGPPISFEHVFVPWIDVATRRLLEECPSLGDLLTEELLRTQQRRLLKNLANFARFVFTEELATRRCKVYQGNDFLFGLMSKPTPQTVYIQTVRALLETDSGGGCGWMTTYPALARLLGVRVAMWIRSLVEFAVRLDEDQARFACELDAGEALGDLVALEFGAGDSHNGGRSVAICSFASGFTVVYKPRSGSIDVAFAALIDRMNEFFESDLRLRVPRTLDCSTRCWSEYISPQACTSLDELRQYFRRMGTLLAVIHLLQGNDFHLENVIAHGAHPVAIDLETVCVPDSNTEEMDPITDRAREIVSHSVLRTMLLPNVMGFRGASVQSMGAIQVQDPRKQVRTMQRLVNVNTDFQRWGRLESTQSGSRSNSQAWVETGEVLSTEEQQSETSRGYESAYRALYSQRAELLCESSPIHGLCDAWVRVLNRSTNIYARLLVESSRPGPFMNGVDRWVSLERLGLIINADSADEKRPAAVQITDAEVGALLDGDIAYFIAPGSGTTHWVVDPVTGKPVELPQTTMKTSAVDCALEQVKRMSEDDLAFQIRVQGESYQSAIQSLEGILHDPSHGDAESVDRSERPLRELVVEALEQIESGAIDSGEHLNWIDVTLSQESDTVVPSPLDESIYAGRGGLCLLFERAYRVLGERRWLELACGAVNFEFNQSKSSSMSQYLNSHPPTGLLARPGIVAAAWAIGRHEGYGHYRAFAETLAVSVSDRVIRKDDSFDVISGSAGYLLLLLRLNEQESLPGIEPLVTRLAQHLLDHACDLDGIGWRSDPSNIPLCGFGHGRAGIALALLEAGRLLDRPDLRAVALEAFEAEHRLRGDVPERGWPDYRSVKVDERSKARFSMNRWCSGSEGIALSRAAALQIVDVPFLRDDLDFALAGIRSRSAGRNHICCGQAGRILTHQTLRRLQAGAGLDEDSSDPAFMAGVLEASFDSKQSLVGVGLFQGLAGVVWTALSLLEDDGSDLLLIRP